MNSRIYEGSIHVAPSRTSISLASRSLGCACRSASTLPPFYQQRMIDVTYSAFTAEWNIRNKNAVSYSNIAAYMTYGTERRKRL